MADRDENREKMQNVEMHPFRFVVHRIGTSIQPLIANENIQVSENALGILCSDGSLYIERTEAGNVTDRECALKINDVQSFAFSCTESMGVSPSSTTLAVVSQQNFVTTYTLLKDETLHKDHEYSLSQVLKGLPDDTELQTVSVSHFTGLAVTLIVNSSYLMCLTLKEGHEGAIISLTLPKTCFTPCFVRGETLVVVNTDQSKICFYDIHSGKELFSIDLTKIDIDFSTIQSWCSSKSLDNIIFAQHTGDLIILDLSAYSAILSQRKNELRGSVALQTCEYGDTPWRGKLLHLHGKDVRSRKSPSDVNQISSVSHNMSGKKTVSGFSQGIHAKAQVPNPIATTCVQAPDCVKGYSVENMCVDDHNVSITYMYNDTQMLSRWSLKHHLWQNIRLSSGEHTILSNIPSIPHLVVTGKELVAIVDSDAMDQERLVSELMTFGGAPLADSVCHLNNWGRCSLPIHTLEVGLKHRQLDTVTYFLNSKQKYFTSIQSLAGLEVEMEDELPRFGYLESLNQLEPALKLMLESVRSSLKDKNSQTFGKQVLDAKMEFMYELFLDGLVVLEGATDEAQRKDILQATEKVQHHIEEMRKYVRLMEESVKMGGKEDSVSVGSSTSASLMERRITPGDRDTGLGDMDMTDAADEGSEESSSMYRAWDKMDTMTVIEDGIVKNKMPELQQYFLQRENHELADYSNLCSQGLQLTLKYIKSHDLQKAKQLLTRMGMNVVDQMWHIAMFTLDIDVCMTITECLSEDKSLSEDQIAMVTFLKEVNKLYPSRNFHQQQDLYPHIKDCDSHQVQRLKSLVQHASEFDLISPCGALGDDKAGDEHRTPECYNEILLAWIQHLDTNTKDLIRLDVQMNNQDAPLEMFSSDMIWVYLLSRNMTEVLVAWIDHSFNVKSNSTDFQWPVSSLRPLDSGFVNKIEFCTSQTGAVLRREFASHGIFTEETLDSFPLLLNQLSAIGGPLLLPHPLQRTGAEHLRNFHGNMVKHCIHRNLPLLLWMYCSTHKVPLEIVHLSCDGENVAWLSLFLCFYALVCSDHQEVSRCMYESSLENSAVVWGDELSSVGEMLKGNHPLPALATLMYSPHKLNQVTFVTQQLEAFDGMSSESVERVIQAYPKLHMALFPASVSDVPKSDVSMYHLLQGNAPFDPSKLFGWQSTNTVMGEDALRVMPYFSRSELMEENGYNEHLRYNYYLNQGRPLFAFSNFLAEEFKNGGHTLSSKRLAIAIGTSLWIGVKFFHNAQIATACVVFQELLGHDSLLLRAYIHIGNEILQHRHLGVTGTMERRREQLKKNEQEVVDLLLQCIERGGRSAMELKMALEAAILAGITRDRLNLCSFEAGERWTLAVLLCQLLQLPYSTEFLDTCADANQWLPFIWFAQLHQYSKDQLSSLLYKFKSSHLQEHLRYVLVNADLRSLQSEGHSTSSKKRQDAGRDKRLNLYSKIGVLKQTESDSATTSDDEDNREFRTDKEMDDCEAVSMMYNSCPDDIFGIIFAAQTTNCPWKTLLMYSVTLKNCLFAELAACQQSSSILACLCGWLVSMMDDAEHERFIGNHGKCPWRYNLSILDQLIDEYIRCKCGSLLVTAFDIFQENSPLIPFLQFYEEFTETQNFSKCRLLLEEFKEAVFQFRYEQSRSVSKPVGDSKWLERTTYRVIQYMLLHTDNIHLLSKLLEMLESESMILVFNEIGVMKGALKCDADFRQQNKIVQCIRESDIDGVNFVKLFSPNPEEQGRECVDIIEKLLQKQLYDVARTFATLCSISADYITIQQINKDKDEVCKTDLWSSPSARTKFYLDCCQKFKQHKVTLSEIAKFFHDESSGISTPSERVSLFEMAYYCIREISDRHEESAQDLYKLMWMNRIQAKLASTQELETENEDMFAEVSIAIPQPHKNLKKELMHYGKMPDPTSKPKDLDDNEVKVLIALVGELLNDGLVSESCRVTTLFSVFSQDLAIILTCIRLSLQSETIDSMSPQMLHLVRSKPEELHRQSIAAPVALLRNSSTISLMSNIQPVIDTVSAENEAKISAMECIMNHCNDGRPTCVRVLTAFKIAAVLGCGYDDVVTGEDYHILRSLLKTSCLAKFRLATDFLATSSLTAEQVAGFVADAILQTYRISLGDVIAGDSEMFFDPSDNMTDFHQIVRLCREPSLLGNRLVDSVALMAGDLEDMSDKVLTLQTELLIMAHECYTAACDMEGISNILRAARILTSQLVAASEYQLMTRLLTGVGRYNEMTYIFDALQQSHQFELLLGKRMEKESKIKTAILDYLKRYHPADTETYTMVALKFMMYREIAQLLEDNANKILNKLKGRTLDNSDNSALQKVAQFLAEAAESYVKDNCLRHAQTCIRKARLVALQIKYLSANQQFINLTRKGANLLIADHPLFTEVYIICEAYQQRENWPQALCNNVINRGDMKYLQEFRAHVKITPQLVEEAVERYQQCTEKSPQAPNNIKKLLPLCKDVKVQYRIAKQLGLRDVVANMEKGDSKSYISDFSCFR